MNDYVIKNIARNTISFLKGIFVSEEISATKAEAIAYVIEELLKRINKHDSINDQKIKIVKKDDELLRKIECSNCSTIHVASKHYFRPSVKYANLGMLEITCPCCHTVNQIIE